MLLNSLFGLTKTRVREERHKITCNMLFFVNILTRPIQLSGLMSPGPTEVRTNIPHQKLSGKLHAFVESLSAKYIKLKNKSILLKDEIFIYFMGDEFLSSFVPCYKEINEHIYFVTLQK